MFSCENVFINVLIENSNKLLFYYVNHLLFKFKLSNNVNIIHG